MVLLLLYCLLLLLLDEEEEEEVGEEEGAERMVEQRPEWRLKKRAGLAEDEHHLLRSTENSFEMVKKSWPRPIAYDYVGGWGLRFVVHRHRMFSGLVLPRSSLVPSPIPRTKSRRSPTMTIKKKEETWQRRS